MDIINTFSNRVKTLRIEKELTGTELSAMFGQTKSAVSSWEKRGRQPKQEILIKLAEYFDVSLDYLLGTSDIRKEQPVSNETKGFAERLVASLINEDMIDDIENIPSNITDMIISALKADLAKKKGTKL